MLDSEKIDWKVEIVSALVCAALIKYHSQGRVPKLIVKAKKSQIKELYIRGEGLLNLL